MDRIGDFARYYGCEPATEGMVEAVLFSVLAAEVVAIGVGMKLSAKKNAKEKAATQKAYFDLHEIPENERAGYEKKVRESAYQDMVKLINGTLHNAKSKKALDEVREKITKEVREYVNDEDQDIFEPNKLDIKFGLISHNDGEYDLIDVSYNGKGFIPADNVWEIGMFAMKPIADKIVATLREKYAEEIKCKLIKIDHDSDYGTIYL